MKGIKSGILILLMALYSITNYAQSQSDITGEWDVGKQNTLVKIQQQNGVYYGKIKTSDNPKVKIGKLMVKDIVEKNGILGFIHKDLFNPFYYEKRLIINDVLIESVIKNNVLEQTITLIKN